MSDEDRVNENLKQKQYALQEAEKKVSTLKKEVETAKTEKMKLTKRFPKKGDVYSIYWDGGQRVVITCANESLVHFALITGHYTTSIRTLKPASFMDDATFKFNVLEHMELDKL